MKTAVVTGASRGIGRAIALRLAEAGNAVVVHYATRAAAAEEVVAEITAAGGRALAFGADLGDPAAVASFWPRLEPLVEQAFGSKRLDILVNNAGTGGGLTIEQADQAALDHVLQVNLKAPFFLIQGAIPRISDGGRIVNLSSMGVRNPYAVMAAYAPSKAALETLTLLLANQLGPRGITVNAVRPGATATEMNHRATDPVLSKAIAETVALRRVGQPDDIAGIVAFLCSDVGGWVTGQMLDASGGQRL